MSYREKWQWERAMLDDYYNHRWRQLLEPLCEAVQHWQAGRLTHADMDRTIEEAYEAKCVLHNLFSQRQDRAVSLIQRRNRAWFDAWLKDHRPASSVHAPPPV